ncbi:MAG: bifunctional YncE family protein/alkaline phosphatase family protein [Lewinella sp.]|nr:bifunctional YncE family protein/alkaline phosphatase family protein [Lewinella sp.]
MQRIFPLLLIVLLLTACRNADDDDVRTGMMYAISKNALNDQRRVQLPNGWALSPIGQSLTLGDLPLNTIVSTDGKRMAVTNNGQSIHSLQWIDLERMEILDTEAIPAGWLGLALNEAGNRLYASAGERNKVWIYDIIDDQFQFKDSLTLAQPWPQDTVSVAGMSLDEQRDRLYVVTKRDSALYTFDLNDNTIVKKLDLGAAAYTCLYDKKLNKLFISLWDGEAVAVVDPDELTLEKKIAIGYHPNELVIHPDGKRLFVACADENAVFVISTEDGQIIENLNCALYPDAPTGSTTNSLAISPDGELLFAANADNNCLAVFEVEEAGSSHALGYIPTGWYPTAVRYVNDQLWIANGKGFSSKANPDGPNPYTSRTAETEYIGNLFVGTLTRLETSVLDSLNYYTQLVYVNTPYTKEKEMMAEGDPDGPIPRQMGEESPIKYVFYVIKENRTYDQVLGDMTAGNGDPSLCLFPDSISPNHHALAGEFVLIDNFYVDAEVSADGHNWSMAAYATDYTEKIWPTSYGGRGGSYDFEGQREISYPKAGYIWDYCQRANIPYRTYGEFANLNEGYLKSLEGHAAARFPGYDLMIKDTLRFNRWRADFDSLLAINAVPQFNTVRFGNDHTAGARVGRRTPAAMVADNDLALGLFVEHLSKSPIWPETAIFVLEDDAQNGPDHVDAHRSVLLVASPYTKRKQVISTMYSTASVLRTMELILGLPPMSQYDAAATPLYACFQSEPDLTPYTHAPNRVDLDELNTENGRLSDLSWKLNLDREDQAPDLLFSEIIWKTMRGEGSTMPAPRRGAFIRVGEDEDEDEEGE